MLENLDDIDWGLLSHGHGSAVDVPNMLKILAGGTPEGRENVTSLLHETLWHQGTVYSASAKAIPFLFEFIQNRERFERTDELPPSDEIAVSLICCIASGKGWVQCALRSMKEETLRAHLSEQGQTLEQELEREQHAMTEIHEQVKGRIPLLLPYRNAAEGLGEFVTEVIEQFAD